MKEFSHARNQVRNKTERIILAAESLEHFRTCSIHLHALTLSSQSASDTCISMDLYALYAYSLNKSMTKAPFTKRVWHPVVSCMQTFTRLSNRFDKRLYRVYSRLSKGCTTQFDNRLNEQCCSFNTVVKPVVKPVWQPVVSCKRGFTDSSVHSCKTFLRCNHAWNKILT